MPFESVQDLFSRTAEQFARQAAIDRAGTKLAYADLEARANNLANHLIAGGAAPRSVVAVAADDRFAVITALLACLKAGCAFVPLDPETPGPRLAAMIAQAAPAWFVAEAKLLPAIAAVAPAGARVICPDAQAGRPSPVPLHPYAEGADTSRPAARSGPDDLAYIYFTSGSTGRPKGIAGRLKGVDHFIRWEIEALDLGPSCRVSQLTSPSFDAFLRDVFVPLCAGGTVCVPDSRETVLDRRRLVDWLDLEEIELVHCVPSLFRSLVNEPLSPDYFQALRYVLLSGEPLPPADVARWTATFGERVRLVNLYGPTETTMTKFFYFASAADGARKSIPIGKPMPGARALLLDAGGKVCPPGTIGEIYIRTPYRSLGYYGEPELTAEVFVRNPFNDDPADLVYRTGDLGRVLEDGNFEFLGRKDGQVKVRGVRVELGEVENGLRTHPAVRDVAVVDREDGAGGRALCAYVVLDGEVAPGELREHLLGQLQEAMVPAHFVALKELPRTLSGKIDRKALPAPEADGCELAAAFVAPRTLTEEQLAGIWCGLLNLRKVGVHSSFFEVGGHSLLATQLLSRVRAAFDVELPLNCLFEKPTVAGLAEAIEAARRAGEVPRVPPITRQPRQGDPPSSFAQQRLWFIDRLNPGNPAYNIPSSLLLSGPLDVAAMRRALSEVVCRHEALRTSFPSMEGKPVQRIAPASLVPLPLVDLAELPEPRLAAEWRRLLAAEAARPFRLDRGPLLRAVLLRLGDERHALLLTMHHIVSDDWSSSLLLSEWSGLYAAFAAGLPSPLPELPVQYADFALWQRQWLAGPAREGLLSYWRDRLAGAPAAFDLPTDRPRPAVQGLRGSVEVLRVPRSLLDDLGGLSRGAGTTLFMTLATAFATLLSRLSGQRDLVVGTPTAGRGRAELEKLIGFFVNPLVLRFELAGEPSFREVLERVRETVLGALAHQDLPFDLLIEHLQPVRDRSRAPMYQVAFGLQNVPTGEAIASSLALRTQGQVTGTSKLDLDLNMGEAADGLGGSLEYNTDLFDRTTARRLLDQFLRVLERVASAPGENTAEIDLLGDAERQQLLVEWTDTAAPAGVRTLPELIAAQAGRRPHAVALTYGEHSLTYRELDRRVNRLARHLLGFGIGPEVIVGLCLERSLDMVVGLLGVLRAGAAYLPLDPSYPLERLALTIGEAQPLVLVAAAGTTDALPAHWGFLIDLDASRAAIAAESAAPLPGASPQNMAYLIFTSGSTGEPKGVAIGHRGLRNLAEAQIQGFGVRQDSRVLQFASLSFDASISEIAMALGVGATLCLAPRRDLMPGPGLVRLLAEREITHATLPPSALAAMPAAELPALATLIVAGEACPSELIVAWAPGRRLLDAYGPTEATVCASFGCRGERDPRPTIGRPIHNVEAYVLDAALQPAPAGVPGDLYVGGAGLARGYHGRPASTAERFVPHPMTAATGERLYATGDRARWRHDGGLQFLGRADRQVKVRGFRIEPGEVEAVLARHPAVRESAIVARGETPATRRLVAYFVPRPGLSPSPSELRAHLERHLPEHMVPALYVPLAALPLSPAGKVDRDALPEPGRGALAGEGRDAPGNPLEEVLAAVWAEVLEVEQVGVRDNFFDLGGYSLAATRVLARVRDLYGVELDLVRLFQAPTVAAQAEDLERRLAGGEARPLPPLKPAPRDGELPLSFAQELMWRAEQEHPGHHATHVPSGVRLDGDLDVAALAGSLDEIVRRHEALRTTFPAPNGRPRQQVHPPRPTPLPLVDLAALPAAARDVALERLADEQARRPFDLARGPLARCLLFRLAAREHALLLVCHHIVTDQWSAALFTRELAALYDAFSQGRPSPLPELAWQVPDYAVWQRQHLTGESVASQLAYWRSRLAGAVPLALPTDRPRAGRVIGPRAGMSLLLPPGLASELQGLGRQAGATLFMTVVAAFATLLHGRTGETDLVLDFPIANRKRPELEPLIGFFPNRLVLRCNLAGVPSFLDLLRQVQRAAVDAYAHQDLPFELLMRELAATSGLRSDLLRVSCNAYNAPQEELKLAGLTLRPLDVGARAMAADLSLLLRQTRDGVDCGLFYRTDLYEPQTIAGMKRQLHALLQAIVADPDQPLSTLLTGPKDPVAGLAGMEPRRERRAFARAESPA